ncbi:MAG: PEP/pyruvate-binding domain-containing protein [Acetivibrionales bacterium]|jgi:pyruvate,water dikinase
MDNINSDYLLDVLKEREKELNCLYMIDEILENHQLSVPELFKEIIKVLPSGWRYPEACRAKILYKNQSYQSPGFISSPLSLTCNIKTDGNIAGNIEVVYIQEVTKTDEGYFLYKEKKLIKTVADRIGQMLVYRQMKSVMNDWETSKSNSLSTEKGLKEWEVVIEFLKHTDHSMLLHICRKLTNYLLILGVNEASDLFSCSSSKLADFDGYSNYPTAAEPIDDMDRICENAFRIAEKYIGADELKNQIKRWMQEENAYSLIKAIGSISPTLHNIIEALRRFQKSSKDDEFLFTPKGRWLNVGLINNFLSDKPDFIYIANQYLNYSDFYDIINRIIYPAESQGRIGGKGTGLFLASKILTKESSHLPQLLSIKTPKTWYITTDTITKFLHYNDLEELNEQKYKEIQEIRLEYRNVIQLMKSSRLPPEIINSLSVALDDFDDLPIIVRSSSVLEDQTGASFSGKYKSLFLANQGSKQERLEALQDAIIEVYASIFAPDPIQYRAEKNLLDIHEEMGILIQQVVGNKVGKYFFPLFSGVAFSNNEYRWSPRIKREDGLIRMVPGLGTRAVDRLTDDFPILVSPQQPGIKVNIVPEEIKRYSPKKIDVINLESNSFETLEISELLRECSNQINSVNRIVSIMEYDHIRKPNMFEIDFKKDDLVVTFDGIINDSHFITQINTAIKCLKTKLGYPVDIEFASDGKDLYLLQCRPQSLREETSPAPIPQDILSKDIIFSAKRYVSNGLIQNISHIVYVDPQRYGELSDLEDLKTVGKIVGALNSFLPKRQFILIGPGRWGSRGDIKLGVSVTYADICNTAALIEVAKKKSGYIPELSFGTHFFQDLVEANIRVLPLYPDDDGIIFNEKYLTKSKNILKTIFPEYERFEDVIRVIDVPAQSEGLNLSICMNADLSQALAFLTPHKIKLPRQQKTIEYEDYTGDEKAWRWRYRIAEQLAAKIDSKRFGVNGFYLFGSTGSGTAGPGSDLDILIHFTGNETQRNDLVNWLEGWSMCLAEINYMNTGYRIDKLLDYHIITDEDIKNKDSFAIKINHPVDPAIPLKIS